MVSRNHHKIFPTLPRHVGTVAKPKRECINIFHAWWAWEIAGAIVSVWALIALIVVLKNADQQQQRPWLIGNTQLTLNTVIAVISTILRTSLLVVVAGSLNQSPWNWFARRQSDQEASGQPLKDLDVFGEAAYSSLASLKLLWRTKFRHLASLGAVLTILSLAFDAFTQQVLGAETRTIQNASIGSNLSAEFMIPRGNSWKDVMGPSFPGSTLDLDFNIPFDAQTAVLGGILGTKNQPLKANCPTGQCNWPITPTLGLCSTCTDVRNQVNFPVEGETMLNYSLHFSPGAFDNPNNISVTLGSNSTDMFSFASVVPRDTPGSNFTSESQNVTTVWALGVPPSLWSNFTFPEGKITQSWANPLIVAYSCSFHFCLQAYNASSIDGNFQPEPAGVWDQMIPTDPNDFGRSGSGIPEATWVFSNVPESMNVENASEYVVSLRSRDLLSFAWANALFGSVGSHYADPDPMFDQSADTAANQGIEGLTQAIWLASDSITNMTAKFQQIADTFTTYMRSELPAPLDARYAPTIFSDAIFVVVRWPWLTYPLGLVLAGHVFFIATLFQTRRRKVRPWKSLRLPLLLADMDDVIRESAAGGLYRSDGLEERVGQMRVRMEYDGEDALAFKRVETERSPGQQHEGRARLLSGKGATNLGTMHTW